MNQLNILIRCDASTQIGLGHITRCLVLANDLKDKGHTVFFAMKDNAIGKAKLQEQGFQYFLPPLPFNYYRWITSLTTQLNINIFIGDIRDGLPRTIINTLKKKNILTVAIDEPSDYRKACDLCFYPPHAQLEQLDWSGFNGKIKQGLEYVLLRPEFYGKKAFHTSNSKELKKEILVMLGGTDPMQLTLPIINTLSNNNINVHTIISKNHPDREEIQKTNANVHFTLNDMDIFLQNFDYAIISFGMTAYELMILGIPSTHILLDKDHEIANRYFLKEGVASSLLATKIGSTRDLIDHSLSIKPCQIAGNLIAMEILKETMNAI